MKKEKYKINWFPKVKKVQRVFSANKRQLSFSYFKVTEKLNKSVDFRKNSTFISPKYEMVHDCSMFLHFNLN